MPTVSAFDDLASLIRVQEIGRAAPIATPFGRRLVYYADLTATGRFVHFVEAWLARVRPYYGNTHTSVSSTGRVMGCLREDARRVIHRAVGAGPDDIVLFTGSGATAAINKLVGLLGIRIPDPIDREFALSSHIAERSRPAVLLGPYEHHSNHLPWIESIATVVEVDLDARGQISLSDLERKLEAYRDRPLLIGAFSAASNVTGLLTDVGRVAATIHAAGGLAVFDYAAAAPYVPIDMHPADPAHRIDALFVSPHKFAGGPNASGVLVAHRSFFRSARPEHPGGGTVDYVGGAHRADIDYATRLEEREEGGTPAIIGDLRAGVAFLLKEMLGADHIREHEIALATRAIARLSLHPRIQLYGPLDLPRLPILSFNIRGLHHDFVSTLLDHLFGIQNRAGCSCAGPYGHRLLGIGAHESALYRSEIARGNLGLKPGWVRISLPFYATDGDVEFVLRAVELIADRGDLFLPLYRLGLRDGVWRHIERPMRDILPIELTEEALYDAARTFGIDRADATEAPADIDQERLGYLDEAARIADELEARFRAHPPDYRTSTGNAAIDQLLWFRFVHLG